MPDVQQLTLALPAHRNQHLFSDHYLNENLASRPQWQALRDKAQPVMEQMAIVFSDKIIGLVTELNDRVYALFNLTPDEIKLIEESTKYKYGEV